MARNESTSQSEATFSRAFAPIFTEASPRSAADWVSSIQAVIGRENEALHDLADTYGRNSTAQLGGFYAEAHHAATFNIDAAVRESSEHVTQLRSQAAASPDLQTSWGANLSSKYNHSPVETLAEQAKHVPGDPGTSRYAGMERLVPADQLDATQRLAGAKVAKEVSQQPDVAHRYAETQANLTDHVQSPDGGASQPLTKAQADAWAKDAQAGRVREFTYQEQVSLASQLKEIGAAAGTAAVINVSIQAAPVVIRGFLRLLRDPDYSGVNFLEDMGRWTQDRAIPLATDSFVKAALAASLAAADKAGQLPGSLSGASPLVYAGVAITAVDAAKQLWSLAHGQCTAEQAASEVFKSGLRTSAALAGKAIGQAVVPIPVVGAILGSLVATYIVDQGIGAVENSQAIRLLRALDEHFAAHRDVLQGIFAVTVDYAQVSRAYDVAIAAHRAIEAGTLRHLGQGQDLKDDHQRRLASEQLTIEELTRRNRLLGEIKEGIDHD